EPEEESPILFLRLRKATLKGQQVFAVAPFASSGSTKLPAQLLSTLPGAEGAVLAALADRDDSLDDAGVRAAEAMRRGGAAGRGGRERPPRRRRRPGGHD